LPELPEVETARRLIADAALHRRIVDVDDSDTFVCRPHAPGELRAALTGRTLTAARRRGKAIWCETSGLDGATVPGPDLGIHLGMSGSIVVTSETGEVAEGGEDRIYRALKAALESAAARGGAHTGDVIAARHPGGTCPRCGAEMRHGTIGGRSTWWCSREQRAQPR